MTGVISNIPLLTLRAGTASPGTRSTLPASVIHIGVRSVMMPSAPDVRASYSLFARFSLGAGETLYRSSAGFPIHQNIYRDRGVAGQWRPRQLPIAAQIVCAGRLAGLRRIRSVASACPACFRGWRWQIEEPRVSQPTGLAAPEDAPSCGRRPNSRTRQRAGGGYMRPLRHSCFTCRR